MNQIEIVGIIASVLVVLSMCFKTTSFKGTIIMRVINGIGSALFAIYGGFLFAYSTLAANSCAFFINLFYLVKEIKDHKGGGVDEEE